MLFRNLCLIFHPRVIVESTAHKIASLAVIFASPAIFDSFIDSLRFYQIEMRLGFDEVSVPFLKLPKIVGQHSVELGPD